MSQEVKECLDSKDVDMCMKQIEEIMACTKETKQVMIDEYYDHADTVSVDEVIQRIEIIESRVKQLDTMMKFSFDVSKRKDTKKTTCISPWFFMGGAMLILCRKKM
jgi:outer membrane protein W